MAKLTRLAELGSEAPFQNDALVESLTERSELFLFSYSPKLKSLVTWSKNAPEILGVKDSAIARDGNLFLRHVHPDDRFLLLTDLEHTMRGHAPYRATYRWIRPDTNEVRWLHCRARVVTVSSEAGFGIEGPILEGFIVDLSSELAGSLGRFAGADSITSVLGALPTMVFTLDRDLRLLRANRRAESVAFNFGDPAFRHEQLKSGRPFLNCFGDPEHRAQFQAFLTDLIEARIPTYRTRITVHEAVFSLEAMPIAEYGLIEGILLVVTDVTDIARLERQLAEVQKAEGLRLLAAGISHNFNNALQGIIGHASAMKSHPDRPDLVREAAQSIIDTVNRSAELTRQMMMIDDGGTSGLPLDMNLMTMAAVNRVEDLFLSGVKVSVAFGSPPTIRARQDQLVETIEALLRNAREALTHDGALSLKTYTVHLSDFEVQDLRGGTYAKLSITDTGRGMDAEARKRCIEPFFTTKERDHLSGIGLSGQGLGLSKAYGIVRKLGGTLTIESAPGLGCTVAMYLPAAESSPEVGARVTAAGTSIAEIVPLIDPAHPPSILVVDDDSLVLSTVASMLRELGYSCITAESYHRALALLNEHGAHLQLVLLDAVMPGMDGPALLQQMKKIRRDLTILGFTGGSQDQADALTAAGASAVLRKPIDPSTLKRAIESSLGAKAA